MFKDSQHQAGPEDQGLPASRPVSHECLFSKTQSMAHLPFQPTLRLSALPLSG